MWLVSFNHDYSVACRTKRESDWLPAPGRHHRRFRIGSSLRAETGSATEQHRRPRDYPRKFVAPESGFLAIKPSRFRERNGAAGRSVSALSFHSLRHSFNSALANAGVSQELRQKLTGHASADMNTVYTHHDLETIRTAVQTLPRLPKV
jgi:integrase